MSTHTTRPASLCPDPTPADCRHSRAQFDCLFGAVAGRADLSAHAKLVHARLVSMHRMGAAWTQAEIGEGIGLSRHQVWRAIGELVAADLLEVVRHGQGYPSSYVLLGIDADDLAGRASRRRTGRQPAAGQPGTEPRHYYREKKTPKNDRYKPSIPTDPAAFTSGPLGAYIRT